MGLLTLLVFCSVLCGCWVYGQDLRQQVEGLEHRLQVQGEVLSTYVLTLQELNARVSEQERTIQDQNVKLSQQDQAVEKLRARLLQQKSIILEQAARLSRQDQDQRPMDKEIHALPAHVIQQQEEDGKDGGSPPDPAKRSDDGGPLEAKVDLVTQQVLQMSADLQVLKNTDQFGGATYVHWGSTGCPSSSELVYTGLMGGPRYTDRGGPGNFLCLTSTPRLDAHLQPSKNGFGYVYGSEYEICPESECNTTPACAVCRVARASTVMIPGTNTCTSGWTKEYSGYVMAGANSYSASSEYICVNSRPEHHASSTNANGNENTIYYIHTRCGALPCPPYANDKILTCTVCSK